MYRTKPLFEYADGMYMIMQSGLPDRFYPEEPERKHITNDYVICFMVDTPEDVKQKLIKDYAEYHKKEKESGLYR